MDEFYETGRIIQAHEVDFTNRLRLDSLFIMLQDTAADHATLLNLGYKALIEHNFAWVLSWVKVEITESPKFADELRIKTWPKKKYKLYSLRDFFIYNKEGQIIIRASTAWLPVNMKSKRIIDTSALPVRINYMEDESAINELPRKVTEPGNREFILSKKMRYADIDLNQHVNNIRYIELIMDSFPKEQYQRSRLKIITVNFISESRYSDEIEVYKYKDGTEDSDIIGGVNKENSKTVFQASVKWELN